MDDFISGGSLSYDVFINVYDGTSAEAIAERPTVNGSLTNLSNFGTMDFFDAYANGTSLDQYSPNGTRHGITMVNDSRKALAVPSGIGGSGFFTDTQRSCH